MEKTIFVNFIINSVLVCGTINIGLFVNNEYEIQPLVQHFENKRIYTKKERLNFIIQSISEDDSFKSYKMFCNLLENTNLAAVISSEFQSTSPMIQSITTKLTIPYIQTKWNLFNSYLDRDISLNFHPEPNLFSIGLAKLVESLQWQSFLVLYEDFEGFLRLQEVLKLQKFDQKSNVIVKRLNFDNDIRATFKEIKQLGERHIVLDCKRERMMEALEQAKNVGVMTFAYSYFLVSLDAHTLDLQSLGVEANITTVRTIDFSTENLKTISKKVQARNPYIVKTETVLIYEAIELLIEAFNNLYSTQNVTHGIITCQSEERFIYGPDLLSYIKTNYPKTLKNLPFDSNGKLTDFPLHLIEGNRDKIIATWESTLPEVVNFYRTAEESYQKQVETLLTRVQNISSKLQAPYLMLKHGHENKVGNDRFEGYVLDLINKIADKVNFKYNIILAEGGASGIYNEVNQQWTGIIGDVINGKALFGISDLTITSSRESVVDFSMPFMRLGIGILLQKPKSTVSMFAFLNPFSPEVWMYTATLYLTVSIVLYFVARMAPGDWENAHPCDLKPKELENIWTISNCLWLTMGLKLLFLKLGESLLVLSLPCGGFSLS